MSIGKNIGKGINAVGWFMAIGGLMLVVLGLVLIGKDVFEGIGSWISGIFVACFGVWIGLVGCKTLKS